MNLTATLEALRTLQESDTPTTAQEARAAVKAAGETLAPLRTWVNTLDSMLADAEAYQDVLDDTADDDADERAETHESFTTSVQELREHLLPDEWVLTVG